MTRLSSRRFTFEHQLQFAELSGDWNPVHVDPTAARRTIFGDAVVHGVHTVIWALDCLARVTEEGHTVTLLNTKFKRQVHLSELLSCSLIYPDQKTFELLLESDGSVVVSIDGSFSEIRPDFGPLPTTAPRSECRDMSFEELMNAAGSLPLFIDEEQVRRIYPNIFRIMTPGQLAELLATTRLVGMECPGRHCVYLGHNLRFCCDGARNGAELKYEVIRSDPRFSMLWLNVTGVSLRGTLTAFVGPRPQVQAAIDVVRRMVGADEFINARALVIGGSRGLGEITAKIIAAGGGHVWITYNRGQEDAQRVATEIHSAGLQCDYFQFDARTAELSSKDFGDAAGPNQVYYFATPPISLEGSEWFSSEKFDTYCRFYVSRFATTVASLIRVVGRNLTVFYPSTIFLEQFETHSVEYCAAKAAGELVCRDLEQLFPPMRVYAPRLPRMTTDQNVSLLPTKAQDSLSCMLPVIRLMPTPQ